MNKEGYKDPTQEKAVGKVTQYEKLYRKYNVRKGDKIRISVEVNDDPFTKSAKTRKRDVTVVSINTHFITLRLPAGYCTSMNWDDFQKARC